MKTDFNTAKIKFTLHKKIIFYVIDRIRIPAYATSVYKNIQTVKQHEFKTHRMNQNCRPFNLLCNKQSDPPRNDL